MHKEYLYQFKEHLAVLNRTAATIDSYSDHVRLYLEGLTKDIKAVTASDMEAYVASLFAHKSENDKTYATGTVIVKVRALKRFFEYLEQANHIFINPMEYIQEPKKEKKLPRTVLTVGKYEKSLISPTSGLFPASGTGQYWSCSTPPEFG